MPGPVQVLIADPESKFTRVPAPLAFRDRSAVQTATINVTYSGFSTEAQTAFQHAVDIWETLIGSRVPIEIIANWTPLGTGVLGSAGPTCVSRSFAGAPRVSAWYPYALRNMFVGSDGATTGPCAADISANFNSTFSNWYLGVDGATPVGQYDLVTVVMHEIAHGLGFSGSMVVSGGEGGWGVSDLPFAYDQLVETGSAQAVLDTALFPNPSVALAGVLTGADLFWVGTHGVAGNGGTRPRLYAPSTWMQGSSFSHLDEDAFSPGHASSLMTPFLGAAESIHSPGAVGRGVLEDLGWNSALPTTTEQQILNASDGRSRDRFGTAVAIDGTTVLIGAPDEEDGLGNDDEGAVYVFELDGSTWSEQQKLTEPVREKGGGFGSRLAMDGDTAVVAALGGFTNNDGGRAYVFVRSGSAWVLQQKLVLGDPVEFDAFGSSVAIDGDTLVVGAAGRDIGPTSGNHGAAYVFVRSGTTWTLQQELTASDAGGGFVFGSTVALSGSTVFAADRRGRVYVFTRSGTTWTEQQAFDADGESGDPISLSGDSALIGQPQAGIEVAGEFRGTARVYSRSGNTWTAQAMLLPSDNAVLMGFGSGVSLDGPTALIGAAADDSGGYTNRGSAYVYARSGNTWTQQRKLAASDGQTNSLFGNSVDMSGGTAIVGARWHSALQSDRGAAYIFNDLETSTPPR